MQVFSLANGTKVEVEVKEHPDGYSISHREVGTASYTVTCTCAGKGSVTTTCPTSGYTCNCTGASPVLTCD